jgi:hypothetical protein
MDANQGQLYQGDGNGNFKYIPQKISGLKLEGDVKSILLNPNFQEQVLFGVNGKGVKIYQLNQ